MIQAIASLFELLLEYTMHLLSYARILGMAAAHLIISKVILSITGSGMTSFLLAAVVSFVLVIVVETFICSLQTHCKPTANPLQTHCKLTANSPNHKKIAII